MLLTALVSLLGLASPAQASMLQGPPQGPSTGPSSGQGGLSSRPKPTGRMLVSGYTSGALHVFDGATNSFEQTISPVPGAQTVVRGPDGLLYACAESDQQVLRIDPQTLAIIDVFVGDDPMTGVDESGGLDGPTSAVFGPDGHLYVASFNTDEVLRFNGATGEFMKVFVSAGDGTLNGPDAGTTFGPDGDLYVPSFWNNRVLRFDGKSGESRGIFISAQPSGLSRPRDIKFHGGQIYVASSGNGRVLRYDSSGNYLDLFASSPKPYSLAFHPNTGDLYVVNNNTSRVSRHDGITGALLGTPVSSGSGGLIAATYIYFLVP